MGGDCWLKIASRIVIASFAFKVIVIVVLKEDGGESAIIIS